MVDCGFIQAGIFELRMSHKTEQGFVSMRQPFTWVDHHAKQIAAFCMDGERRGAHLSMMWELGATKHRKIDENVKKWAGVLLDEKKRTAHLSAIHERGMKNHQKMDRTIQFWTRTAQIYASYKVQITFLTFCTGISSKPSFSILHCLSQDFEAKPYYHYSSVHLK